MIQKIKKANHYSWPRRFGIAPKVYTLKFTVDKSWWYPFNGSYHVNKLGGHSLGIHQMNSVRLGYTPEFLDAEHSVNIFHYETLRWEDSNDNNLVCNANIGDVVKISRFYRDIYYYKNNQLISLYHHPVDGPSYWLNAYFGGKPTAPHDIIVKSVIL